MNAPMQTGHAERAHYPLGPSASSRWRKCVPSIARSAALPEPPTSKAASDGTWRHEWAEYLLSNLEFDAVPYIGTTLEPRINEPPLTAEAADEINTALACVAKVYEAGDEIMLETRLDLSRYFGGTDAGDGTGDVIIYKPTKRELHVIDFKFGFIEVAVEGNTQATQYALGALGLFRKRGVEKITIWIAQPRSAGEKHKRWEIAAADLFDEGEALKADYARSLLPDQPYVVGTHCRFCKVAMAGQCEALREHSTKSAAEGFVALGDAVPRATQEYLGTPSPAEVGAMLKEAEPIRIYLKLLDELAESEARAGRIPVGRKWVATPGRRVWRGDLDEETIELAILDRWSNVEPFDKKLKTPPALEKELGKAEFAKLADLVTKTEGGFSLVSEDDKRPAVEYSKAAAGFEAASNP
jgi:hypothetical protein